MSGALAAQVHSAMWAMLCAVRLHNRDGVEPIRVLACPGLGTGHGRVIPDRAAHLMSLAYATHRRPAELSAWPDARRQEQALNRI